MVALDERNDKRRELIDLLVNQAYSDLKIEPEDTEFGLMWEIDRTSLEKFIGYVIEMGRDE